MQTEGQLLTVKEVAAILNVSDRTVYNLTESKTLKASRIGSVLRYKRSDVDDYINSASEDNVDSEPEKQEQAHS